jgi:hypothetical protein
MRPLRPGQETVLSWRAGALECRVVAAAGQFVLLSPAPVTDPFARPPYGDCSLTYLDGLVPVGWDGAVEPGGHPGELRFRVRDAADAADRRSAVRIPVFADVQVAASDEVFDGPLLDVSAGGLRFRHKGRIAPGTVVRALAVLSESLVIDADAVVRASEPGVTSLEFTEMRGANAQAIGAWTVGVLRASVAGQG